ncbi:MAG: hypothetical protein D6701_14810 [Gemmatimonadetes bacterium]|nr:MAG: hypothetical protein D6701_14810 [Gemmatimonadota bacterium]
MATVAAVVVACGDEGGAPMGAVPWRLDRTLLEQGRGIPFCEKVTADVEAFLSRWDGTEPPSDDYGGTVVVGTIGEIADGMNGFVSSDYSASQHQSFVNGMTLLHYDAELNPVPYLAESWEVNDAKTEIVFHLRDDVFWHDGVRTDAYDVAFTYRRATDPRTGFPNSTFWTYYDRGENGVEVVDSFTVRVRMQPHAEFMDPWRTTTIMPRHLLEDVPPEELKQHPYGSVCPVGNGPFVFIDHRQDASWTFQANPAFPEGLGGRPYLDRYVYRVIPEQTTLLSEVLTGNIDIYLAPRPDQAQRVIDAPNLELLAYPWRSYVYVGWNSRRPQLADARVRRAITRATNREEIVQAILQGYGRVANTSVPPFHWAYDPEIGREELSYDPDAARRSLAEAGWVDRDGDGVRENAEGLPLSITLKYNQGNQQRQDIAEIMQSQLAQVGIEARPQVVEWATLLNQLSDPAQRDFDGVVIAWIVEFKLDDTDLFHSSKYDAPYGYSGTRNPVLDRYLDTLPLIADREDAIPVWRAYQEALLEEQPYTFFYFPDRLDAVNRRIEGVTMDARGEWLSIREWRIPPERRIRRASAAAGVH